MHKNIWASKSISKTTKLWIFNSNLKSILLYGAEKWQLATKIALQKIQTFYNTCLGHILNILWPERITNEELWRIAKQEPLDMQIRLRKWVWKPPSNTTRQAPTWNPHGKRKRGRPRNTWRRDTEY
jgi:hypothetical protein